MEFALLYVGTTQACVKFALFRSDHDATHNIIRKWTIMLSGRATCLHSLAAFEQCSVVNSAHTHISPAPLHFAWTRTASHFHAPSLHCHDDCRQKHPSSIIASQPASQSIQSDVHRKLHRCSSSERHPTTRIHAAQSASVRRSRCRRWGKQLFTCTVVVRCAHRFPVHSIHLRATRPSTYG